MGILSNGTEAFRLTHPPICHMTSLLNVLGETCCWFFLYFGR